MLPSSNRPVRGSAPRSLRIRSARRPILPGDPSRDDEPPRSARFRARSSPHIGTPDPLCRTLAVYWHLRWERGGAWYAPALVSLAAALAVLTIGIAGVVMIALVVGAPLTIDRPRLPRGAAGAAMLGAAVFLAVALPWF